MSNWVNYAILIVVCVPITVIVAYRIVFVLTMRFETRHKRTYVPLASGSTITPRAYFTTMNELARTYGFSGGEIRTHAKSGTFKFLSSTWLSPDRTVLAWISSGTAYGISQDNTVMISRSNVGTFEISSDEFGKVELPQIGLVRVLMNADFLELLGFHEQRLAKKGATLVPFDEDDGWATLESIEEDRIRRLVEAGKAAYIDSAKTTWRYTWRGAISGIPVLPKEEIRSQIDRSKIARPGSPGYATSADRRMIGL